MMKTVLLLFVVAVASVLAEVDYNDQFEKKLEIYNENLRMNGRTTFKFFGGKITKDIEVKGLTVIGLDSLTRTGPCTMSRQGNSATFDYNFGLRMLVATMPELIIHGQQMSAFVRVKSNSIHLRYRATKGHQCKVAIEQLELKDFGDVEFGASRAEFDGKDVNELFQNVVVGAINSRLQSFKNLLQKQLERTVCKQRVSDDFFQPQFYD